MKRIVGISIVLLSFFTTNIWAQPGTNDAKKNQTVLTIDGETVSLEEFETIFKKNNRDSAITQASLDEYMKLYINFRLKVAEAKKLGLDTVAKFKNELAGYRTQLARPYLVDASMLDGLVQEGYNRLKEEVHGYHILVKCDPSAAPSDTARAYQKILQLRNEVIAGKSTFGEIAKRSSEDPSAKDNGGDLGYFTAFQMVYPFESAAYQTKKGEVSMPVRTKYGYHIVKVTDRRPARGEIRVAHIMIRDKQDDANYSRTKIDEVYTKIKAGEKTFEELAGQYSEDGSSAKKGGELPWFGINKMVMEFEDSSFALKHNGDISKPFRTSYGWHIVKRLDYKPLASYEQLEKEIRGKVQKDSRAEKTKNAFLNKLKSEYHYTQNDILLDKLIAAADSNVFNGKWKPKKKLTKGNLITLNNQSIKGSEFVQYLNRKKSNRSKVSPFDYVSNEFKNFSNEQVLKFEDSQLESKYPAFRMLMNEYRDGILLFELTDQKVWSKAVKDTAGLRAFHETRKNNYLWPDRAQIAVFTCENANYSKTVREMLQSGEYPIESIESEINVDNLPHVMYDTGIYSEEDRPLLKMMDWKGNGKINDKDLDVNGKLAVVKVIDFIPAGPKKLTEARGVITSDYQNYLEESWIESLKKEKEGKIIINKEILYSIH
jgi:peptidyl-prolyl cis-trans isomerase SurA